MDAWLLATSAPDGRKSASQWQRPYHRCDLVEKRQKMVVVGDVLRKGARPSRLCSARLVAGRDDQISVHGPDLGRLQAPETQTMSGAVSVLAGAGADMTAGVD